MRLLRPEAERAGGQPGPPHSQGRLAFFNSLPLPVDSLVVDNRTYGDKHR
jgi:hypothetical protein